MTFVLADRVQQTTTTTGTGTITFASTIAQYQSFSAGIGANNTTYYCLLDGNGTNWETGLGTVGAGGTTLARTTIYASTNSNTAISLSSNTHVVFCDYPAAVIGDVQVTQSVSASTATITPAVATTSVVVTVSMNTTLTIANGSYGGQKLRLELLQDTTGSRTIAFDSSVIFGTDVTSFTATTTANKRDLVELFWNSTASKWMFAAVNHGF